MVRGEHGYLFGSFRRFLEQAERSLLTIKNHLSGLRTAFQRDTILSQCEQERMFSVYSHLMGFHSQLM